MHCHKGIFSREGRVYIVDVMGLFTSLCHNEYIEGI